MQEYENGTNGNQIELGSYRSGNKGPYKQHPQFPTTGKNRLDLGKATQQWMKSLSSVNLVEKCTYTCVDCRMHVYYKKVLDSVHTAVVPKAL